MKFAFNMNKNSGILWIPLSLLYAFLATLVIPFSCNQSNTNLSVIDITPYIEEDNLNEAARILLKAQIEHPNDADLLYNLAVVRRLQGKITDAKNMIEKAHQLAPDKDAIKMLMAEILLEIGNAEAAWDYFQTVSEEGRHRSHSQYILGSIYAQMQDWQQAQGCFQAAIELDQRNTTAKAALAIVLVNLGKENQAEAILAEIENPPGKSLQATKQIAEAYLALGDAKKAYDLAYPLTNEYSMDAELWSLIGRAELILLHFSEAESAFTRCLASTNANPWNRVEYAEMLFAAKREDEALAQATEAETTLERSGIPIKNPKLYNLLATLYARRGQMLLAHKYLKKSLQIDQTQHQVKELLTKITTDRSTETTSVPGP